MVTLRWYPGVSWLELKSWRLRGGRLPYSGGGIRLGRFGRLGISRMTDVSILVMVVASLVFQVSDATIGSRKADNQPEEEDFTWKYNGEVNIGKNFTMLMNLDKNFFKVVFMGECFT